MPDQATTLSKLGAAGLAAVLFALAGPYLLPAAAQQAGNSFAEGTCSGLLCDYIGGAQAPAARAQKSVFPEGECGGVLCDAIGGSQAPRRAEPPPPCGGGLLCDLMPYKMGVPVTAAEAARQQEASRQQEAERQRTALASAPVRKGSGARRKAATPAGKQAE